MSSSFILGVLFTSMLWDATILFPSEKITEATLEAVEAYYLTWWNGATTVKVFLHLIVSRRPPTLSPERSLTSAVAPCRSSSSSSR